MRKRLLIIAHAPSPNLRRLTEAVAAGARALAPAELEICVQSPFATEPEHVLGASAVLLGTPENLGYMSGALKDFFDRCYYPLLDKTGGLPYALFVRAGHDGTGTRRAVESIVTGLKWRAFREPLILRGEWREDFIAPCEELGQYAAAGLDAGVF
jgi:NAD(P)H-dependent FMN reductase